MKATKFLSVAILSSVMLAGIADAGSIGRSGGGGSHSSPSVSRSPSVTHSAPAPAPKAPSVAPAPAHTGGIGGTASSVGVRKSEVTAPVAQSVNPGKPGNFTPTPSTTPYSSPSPSYGYAPAPAPSVGSGFGSSFAGALGGTIVGNMLFGNHGHSGSTTVINNGGAGVPSSGTVQSGPSVGSTDSQFNPGGVSSQPKKEYTVWSFIADVFGFVIVVALLIGIAWLFYKGFQLVRNYVNKERGVSTQPFNPTQQFWRIQRAFAEADVTELNVLLGPDVVDELTNGLQPSTLTLHNVSHEVRLANNTEFSIWYKFEDAGETINQVWHYEKFGKEWKLNGIENV